MARTGGAVVILINGRSPPSCAAAIPSLRVFLPENEPERTHFARDLASKLAQLAIRRQNLRQGLLIGEINDAPAREHFFARFCKTPAS